MHLEKISFDDLPFSNLYKTFTSDFDQLAEFYNGNPFDRHAICDRVQEFDFDGDREAIADALVTFNRQFDLPEAAFANLDRLRDPEALAVVTGQQTSLLGGPLYTIFKTFTAIHHANIIEEELERPVIPIFWLGDEDHDYDEVNTVNFLAGKEVESLTYEKTVDTEPAASDIPLTGQYEEFKEQLREHLYETDFSDDLWALLDKAYHSDATFGEAFGTLMGNIFTQEGLVLAGSNHPAIKKLLKEPIKKTITQYDELRQRLESQTQKIKSKFHQQVTLYDSNLFYLCEQRGRVKIKHQNGDSWGTSDQKTSWTTDELITEIEEYPERFSPNVFMRPIIQDKLLPTVAYIGGPGEIAYYAQMKSIYSLFDLQMPVVCPRLSGTLIEPAIDRILPQLPFDFADYSKRIEDLEKAFVEQADTMDIEAVFGEWKQKAEELSEPYIDQITDVDPTLEGAGGKAVASFHNELDKLKGKVYRATKQQEKTQLKRIRKIKDQLYPCGGMQERCISFVYFMNKYGVDIWHQMLEQLSADDMFDRHNLIYLDGDE